MTLLEMSRITSSAIGPVCVGGGRGCVKKGERVWNGVWNGVCSRVCIRRCVKRTIKD